MKKTILSTSQTSVLSPVLDENYSDIIFRHSSSSNALLQELSEYTPQIVNSFYSILHAPLSSQFATAEEVGYFGVPKLFTYIDTASLDAAGIPAVQMQPFLSLSGNGVLVGFLDSGIDYTHPAFRNSDGTTRILRIWDQTDQSGTSPANLGYGTEYTAEQLNEALFSGNPFSVIPETDDDGHGTAVAGIACGSPDISADFSGAAPQSSIAFVRLKPAKQYLRDYFLIPEDAVAYQETDLMLGIRYLTQLSQKMQMPLIICISLGTNQGDHTGNTPLEQLLSTIQLRPGISVITGTGNETGKGHHFLGRLESENSFLDIELLIEEETNGFTIEFWADAPDLFSIGFSSPLGETIQPVQPRGGTSLDFRFLLELSQVSLSYFIVESLSGSQLAILRFQNPTPGIWRIRVVSNTHASGTFHMWLPISGLVNDSVRFYESNPNTTLVIPSCPPSVISTGAYNAADNSLFINSGRGFTRSNQIKPDFAAPGISVSAPGPNGIYTTITGSCAASALTAGAAALLMEGGIRRNPPRFFSAAEIRGLFLRGTQRNPVYNYPNREWGYGTINIYQTFESFLRS